MKLKELMDAGTVTDPKVGYVGAYPYAEVVCGYTAFLLGIQTQVPEAYMEVQYTNSWYDPVAEGEAANALMARGCVIIGQHADSTGAPSAVQAQKDAGSVVYTSKLTCQPAADGSYQVDADGHVTSAFGLDSDGDFVNDTGEAIVDGAFQESVLRSAPYVSLRIDGITELNNN